MSEDSRGSLGARVRRLLRLDVAGEVDDKLSFHLEMRESELKERGMDAAAARDAALARFGEMQGVRAECLTIARRRDRRERRVERLADLGQDVRYGARRLLRSPGFSLVAVLTLSLGIGAATALFSAADQLLLRPLPLREPDRLATLQLSGMGGSFFTGFSESQVADVRAMTEVVEGVAATATHTFSLLEGGRSELVAGRFVSPGYFELLGVRPVVGRFFGVASGSGDAPAGQVEAVVSHRLWRRQLGSDPLVLGRTIRLNGNLFTIVGVAPADFATSRVGEEPAEIWVTTAAVPLFQRDRDASFEEVAMYWPVVRLRAGISAEEAGERLGTLVAQWKESAMPHIPVETVLARPLDPVSWSHRERVSDFVSLLALATGLLLLVAAINVAGMLLARASSRGREIGIRLAIGAGRGRVVRQLVVEGLLLFGLAAVAGTLIAVWLLELVARVPWPVAVQLAPALNPRVLAFALGVAMATGFAFSLVPALQSSGVDIQAALRERAGQGGGKPRRGRGAVVVVQVALSVLLLTCAALFGRSLQVAWSIDPGFDPDGVLVANLDLAAHGYEPPAQADYFARLSEAVRGMPGVESVALASKAPFTSAGSMALALDLPLGGAADPRRPPFVSFELVSADYFRTLRIPLLAGREFTGADAVPEARAAIVNRALAERYWPGEDPLGKRLDGGPVPMEVVGVVETVRTRTLRSETEDLARLYLPVGSRPAHALTLHVRAPEGRTRVLQDVRSLARGLDPRLPTLELIPLNRLIGLTLLPQRIGAWLVGGFGAFGLLLAMLGLYGLLYYSVVQRTREIGIRMALGGRPAQLLRQVLGTGTRLAVAGALIGVATAAAAARLIESLLFGVPGTDPLAYAAVVLLLGVVAVLASLLPARRAVRVDPAAALRSD